MAHSIKSVAQLVDILGGLTRTGEFFNVTRQEVLSWRRRNRIAAEYSLARPRLKRRGINMPIRLFGLYEDGRRSRTMERT